jgi:hypothetical protein
MKFFSNAQWKGVKLDWGLTLQQKNEHSHEPDERKTERQVLRNSVKRKASDDISQRLSKLIREALQEQEEEQLEPKDLKSAAKAIYRRRRKTYPPLHNFH